MARASTATARCATLYYRAGGYAPEDLSKFASVVDRVQGMPLGGLAVFPGAKRAATAK